MRDEASRGELLPYNGRRRWRVSHLEEHQQKPLARLKAQRASAVAHDELVEAAGSVEIPCRRRLDAILLGSLVAQYCRPCHALATPFARGAKYRWMAVASAAQEALMRTSHQLLALDEELAGDGKANTIE